MERPRRGIVAPPPGAHRIERIEVERYRLPLDPPFPAAWDSRPRETFDLAIVRVTNSEGMVGIGSGTTLEGIENHFPLFVGHDPLDMERHHAVLTNIDFHGERPWPLENALWDLAGKIKRKPVWQLLGGTSGLVPCYASTGMLRDDRELADKVLALKERGFPAVKIRFHRGDWRADVRALEAVRAAEGSSIELMVDCNQGWRMPWDTEPSWNYHQALVVARELEALGVYWMEEPLHRCDWRGMAVLHNAVSVRIAAGEMTREPRNLEDLIERQCVDVLQPDATQTCGVTGVARLADTAARNGVAFTPHSWGNGIGLLVNAHVFAGVGGGPWLEYPLDPPEWTPERRDFMLTEPLVTDDSGCLRLSDEPGFGISLNEERLAAYRVAG